MLIVGTGDTDAYTFLRHGHVFAEAMTGNLVLVGVGAFAPGVVAFWHPLVSFGAFLGGVVTLWLVSRGAPSRDRSGRPQLGALTAVILVLAIVGFLPRSVPQEIVVAMIALTAGLQITAFRQVDEASLSTVVMTTNSMQAIGDLIAALTTRDPEARRKARALLVVIGGFVVGVFAGAGLSSVLADRAAWPDAGIFVLVTILFVGRDRRGPPVDELVPVDAERGGNPHVHSDPTGP